MSRSRAFHRSLRNLFAPRAREVRERGRFGRASGGFAREEVPDPRDQVLGYALRAALLGHERAKGHSELLALQAPPALRQVLLDVLGLRRIELVVQEQLDLAEDVFAVSHRPTHV